MYGYTWYLDVVCEEWNALVWPSPKDLQIVMPLPVRKKYGVKILYQPLFCQYLGIFSASDLTTELVSAYLNTCRKVFNYISAYHFHPENYELIQLCKHTFRNGTFHEKYTQWLSLDKPFEHVRQGYSHDRKLNIRRASKFGWTIKESDDIEPMICLFQHYHESKIVGGVRSDSYKLLTTLTEKLLEKKRVKLLYATKDDQVHAGVMLVGEGEMTIYLFNAADETGRRQNARSHLLDHYFKIMAGTDVIFDFESPEVESISNFYKNFGAETKPFLCLSMNRLPFLFREIQELRKRWFLKTR